MGILNTAFANVIAASECLDAERGYRGETVIDAALPPDAQPIRIGVAFLSGDGIAARLIQRITKSPWSHVAVLFDFGPLGIWYYEAMFGKPVRGPLPMAKMLQWQADGVGRTVVTYWLDMPEERVRLKHAIARTYVNCATYGEWQLLAMWAFYRLGVNLRDDARTQVCSEYVARILAPDVDARQGIRTFDEISPADVYWIIVHCVTAKGGSL